MASETPDQTPPSTSQTTGGAEQGDESLTPLEQEVLDEYARLLGNLNTMSTLLLALSNKPSAAILDGLRGLERKTSLVFTLLKASVYSIVLNQQITDGAGGELNPDEVETWRREKDEAERRRREMDG
ncbi:uncharacterized protein K460DRAFT_410136 [Cucurbitaria berberidis CBS 394.84]|uniref:DASH complex subunit DAD3 n=1 Tax=Cucurbitaria berberidis CBS 394.84 TaxID=1168544 RepID=A0A9P4G800_9PLEO|nr:uncharacterized protein K460DRAFT_410136 [Cucurbitaria berberidis CBS 394.84]KAF1840721.1 hypothetical protein K460DRAFT_410136 [Cucurbitaria berberidis CBS 394.84]